MSIWKKSFFALILVGVSAPLAAQTSTEEATAEATVKATAAATASATAEAASARNVELEMREAEKQLEIAAQRIAELSAGALASAGDIQQWVTFANRPMIGITIDSSDDSSPVEGVAVAGISPGSAADEAGLRAGDVITAVNTESLSSENEMEANSKLLDFMQGVEEGDVLDVEFVRNGQASTVELMPKMASSTVFDFTFGGPGSAPPVAPTAPQVYSFKSFGTHRGHGFGDMEMIELNEDLGRYFGTDSGLLIVKAPEDNAFKLQDGDVIKSIDGREPKDILHAVRILGSYEEGETVNIEIMRDKKKQKVSVEIPANRHSFVPRPEPSVAPTPASAAEPAPVPTPAIMVVPKYPVVPHSEERT